MARKLRRYKMAGLPKLTRRQVNTTNALLWSLPQTPFEAGFKERMREVLEPLVHADVDVWFERAAPVSDGVLKRVLAEPTCAAVIGLPPRTEKALVEVDLAVAQMCIDKILGGNAEDVDVQRPLSEIEDGVFSFVLLKVLGLMQSDVASEHSLALKLEGVYGRLADLKERFDVDGAYLVVSFKLFFDTKVGFLRLYLPEQLLLEIYPPTPPSEGPALERSLRRMAERVDLVRALTSRLSVEVGRISFSMADLEQLEVEDIILVEETEVRMETPDPEQPGVLGGRVTCRIGAGHHGVLQGVLQVGEAGRYEVAIEGISPVGEPPARAHLFRDAGDGGGEEMASEDARRLSKRGLVDETAHARDMREAAAARARIGDPRALTVAHEADEPVGAEHSAPDDDDDQGGGDDGEPVSTSAAALLDDVTVAMVVELGRVTVSAADVVGLRAGQVIELSRHPGEPVDLVVDGKRIGKGELVEIDGELGVRILSLAK